MTDELELTAILKISSLDHFTQTSRTTLGIITSLLAASTEAHGM